MVTEKAESRISIPDAERWALQRQGGRSWGVSPPFYLKMEFLKLTFEWKLVIGFQQIKVRFGCKARTHESDREKPACALAAATEALEAPRLVQGRAPPAGEQRAAQRSQRYPASQRSGGWRRSGALCCSGIPWPLLAAAPCSQWTASGSAIQSQWIWTHLPIAPLPLSILVQVLDKNSMRIKMGEEQDSREARQGCEWSCKVGGPEEEGCALCSG